MFAVIVLSTPVRPLVSRLLSGFPRPLTDTRLTLIVVALVRLNFDWMIVCVTALGLSVANVVGYTKCSSDAKAKAQAAQVCDTGVVGRGSGFAIDTGFVASVTGFVASDSGFVPIDTRFVARVTGFVASDSGVLAVPCSLRCSGCGVRCCEIAEVNCLALVCVEAAYVGVATSC